MKRGTTPMPKPIKTKLVFYHENSLLTMLNLNDSQPNRQIKFYAPSGLFSLELRRATTSKTHISVKLTFHGKKALR